MQRERLVSIIAAIAALVGWAGLAIQLMILLGEMAVAPALWRFLGFFTVLANIGAASVATAMAVGKGRLAHPRARLMAATSILMVGVIYSIALRSLWNPTGLQKVADVAMHDATPLLWLVLWLLASHHRLAWRELGWALLPPVAYVIYAMLRGWADGWYAYWFMNPAMQSPTAFVISILILLAVFGAAALALIGVDRFLGGRGAPNDSSKLATESP